MTNTIIFDFDGTLVDTVDGIVASQVRMLEVLGLPVTERQMMVQAIGLPLKECLRRGCNLPEDILDEAAATYRTVFDEVATPLIKDFPGVRPALEEFQRRGLRMCIATSRGSRSLGMILDNLDMNCFFDVIITANDGLAPKPNPDMVLEILRRTGAKAEETIVVGDTTFDLDMGAAAGCRTVGVSYGNHTVEQLLQARPAMIVDDMRRMLTDLL